MARVVSTPKEQEIRDLAREAVANETMVAMDPHQLSRLAYGYFEFRKIENHPGEFNAGVRRAGVVLTVARLAGVAVAVTRMADAGLVPAALHEHVKAQLEEYQAWAKINADSGESDEGLRHSINAAITQADCWNSWARRVLDPDQSGCALEPMELLRAMQTLIDERAASLAAGTQDRLEGALEVQDGWFRWAQEALGLSDAYVEEQKLGVDDLRRMIRERL